jgi:hypothetical protein
MFQIPPSKPVIKPADMTALTRYDTARRALAEAHRVDEVKDIRDKAVAMQAYAKQAQDTALITLATEIRMRAERRAGELLREMEKNKGSRGTGSNQHQVRSLAETAPPKLSDLGVTKTQSSRWQKLAALDAESFEQQVERASKTAYDLVTRRFIKESELARAQAEHGKTIEHGCTIDDLKVLSAAGRRLSVVYADPPWPWETWTPSACRDRPASGGVARRRSLCAAVVVHGATRCHRHSLGGDRGVGL